MLKILGSMFEGSPGKSTIVLKDTCSNCGCETVIEITRTSGGFGLQGGVLIKNSSGAYSAKCLKCYASTPGPTRPGVRAKEPKANA